MISQEYLEALHTEMAGMLTKYRNLLSQNWEDTKKHSREIREIDSKMTKMSKSNSKLHEKSSADGTHLDFAILELRKSSPKAAKELEQRIKDGPSH